MGWGSVNVPGVNALTMPWNETNVWGALSDHDIAVKTLIFHKLQSRRLEEANSDLRDSLCAGKLLAFGNLQQQRLNDAQFGLIASEAFGESHTVTLTNTQKFPFNSTADAPVTVALNTRRKNLFYSVEPEITANVGPAGEIRVTDKQLNGFKVSFDGCGKSVTLILRVKGGMSHA